MIHEVSMPFPNALAVIMDQNRGEVPESMDGKPVVSTPWSIIVGVVPPIDGETLVVLTDERTVLGEDGELSRVFSGVIATPRREVRVCTVEERCVLQAAVSGLATNIEIWANQNFCPDKVCVFLSS